MLWRLITNFLLWTSLGALIVLAISAYFEPETLPKTQVCAFKQITGRPCPGCGLTRAFCAISHGRVADAYHFNPFGFVFYFGAVILATWPLLSWRYPSMNKWAQRTDLFVYVLPAIMVGMLVFGVVRMFRGPFV